MRIIDLSYDLTDTMVVWPGNQRPIYEWTKRGNSESCNVTRMDMLAHTGTHVDSPLHFLMDGAPLDKIPLDRFWGKARLFRFREKPANQEIGLKTVLDSGFSMGEAKIFVLETGIQRHQEQRDYNLKYPVPDHDLLDWLAEQGAVSFMTDATAIDHPADDDSPRHKRWFRNGFPVVENLKNLGELPENEDFIICAMPLKMTGREGSPCRAAAWIE